MKCKVFIGTWFEAMDAFNVWATGKRLTREVIIHTNVADYYNAGAYEPKLVITVFHPDGTDWDATKVTDQTLPEEVQYRKKNETEASLEKTMETI